MGPSGPGSAQRALSQSLRLSPLSPSVLYTYFTGTGQGQERNADGSCKPALMSKVAAQTFLSWATDSPLASKLSNLLPFFIYLSFPLRVCV